MSPEEYRAASAAELATDGMTRMPPTTQTWVSPVGVRVARNGEGIEWQPRKSFARGGVIAPGPRLLEDFLTLGTASAEQIVGFVERHGVLGLPADPGRHRPRGYWREPLAAWHDAADGADGLLAAAARLRGGQPLTDDERIPVLRTAWWPAETGEALRSDDDLRDTLLGYALRTLEDDRSQLARAVSLWMQREGVRMVLTWPTGADAPTLTLGGDVQYGCLAAITVQVALACSRSETTRACDHCGALHAPTRQPRPGQRSFCQRCRDNKVPVRLANRDRRARKQQEKASQK